MNTIKFPLRPGDQGPKVGDLQDALLALIERAAVLINDEAARSELATALRPERAERVYRRATQKLVAAFQAERRLEATGEVDEPTAAALNALLHELGLLDGAESPRNDVVSGSVRGDYLTVAVAGMVRSGEHVVDGSNGP